MKEAVALAAARGDDEEVAMALVNSGIVEENQGRYGEAVAFFEQAR